MLKAEKLDIFSYIGVYYQVTKIRTDRHTEPEISATGAEFEVSGFVQFHLLTSESFLRRRSSDTREKPL